MNLLQLNSNIVKNEAKNQLASGTGVSCNSSSAAADNECDNDNFYHD